MTEPKRLRELPDLPVTLRDALRTLEQQAPSPETVAKVQRVLEALPAPGAAAAFGFGWGAALFVATLGALGWGGWALLSHPRELGTPAPAAGPASEPAPLPPMAADTAATTPVPAVASAAPQPGARPLAGDPQLTAAEPARAVSRGAVKRPDHAHASRASSRDANARAELGTTAASLSAGPASTDTLARAAEAPEPKPEQDAAEVIEPQARANAKPPVAVGPAPGPEPEDEAGLLYRAKRLARSDPAGALRLAESHAQHFPQGAFVEEREVLTIELEHRLGHEAQAKQRAERFLARFPQSAYRAAIQR